MPFNLRSFANAKIPVLSQAAQVAVDVQDEMNSPQMQAAAQYLRGLASPRTVEASPPPPAGIQAAQAAAIEQPSIPREFRGGGFKYPMTFKEYSDSQPNIPPDAVEQKRIVHTPSSPAVSWLKNKANDLIYKKPVFDTTAVIGVRG